MTNQPIDAMHIPAYVFVIMLIGGVMIVLAIAVLARMGDIIRNFIEAVKQDKGVKP